MRSHRVEPFHTNHPSRSNAARWSSLLGLHFPGLLLSDRVDLVASALLPVGEGSGGDLRGLLRCQVVLSYCIWSRKVTWFSLPLGIRYLSLIRSYVFAVFESSETMLGCTHCSLPAIREVSIQGGRMGCLLDEATNPYYV